MQNNSMVSMVEFEGVAVHTNNGPPVRYYPYRTPVVLHTAEKQARYALNATPNVPIKGVKGMEGNYQPLTQLEAQ